MNYAFNEVQVDPVEVDIHNGRTAGDFNWQTQGFELVQHSSKVSDWQQEDTIAATYYAEMEAMAKSLSGCDHALIAGHILRNPTAAAKHIDYAPIQYAHSDFTDTYGDLVRGRYLEPEPETTQTLERAGIDVTDVMVAKRILILQFWRNIGPESMDLPLALCDTRSVPKEDLASYHVSEYAGDVVPFDTYGVTKPEREGSHQWYVFPNMTKDEALAFRTYDSELAEQGGHYWTPHSAFIDPCVHGPCARHSIEVRATCLFA
ncbi:MAG: hypothetical protein ACI9ON_003567 [Limisphaerales bacterium]|jgi:hypothetical protein